jgi:REP element-mobilizing transposase RayT
MFGEVLNDGIQLSDVGQIVNKWLVELIQKYKNIELDEYVIMPNHMHGIIVIVGADLRVCPDIKNKTTQEGEHIGSPLHEIIQWFKTMTTNEYIRGVKQNKWQSFNGKLWQRNYYEHVIRNEDDMNTIREYIINNPLRWGDDENNPVNIKVDGKGTLQHAPTG